MKVLHIINGLGIGGAEKLIVETLPFFKEQGVDVELLVFQVPTNNFEDKLIETGIKYYSLDVKYLYSPITIFKIRKYLKNKDIIHVHLFPAQYWVAIANFLLFKKKKILLTTEHNTHNKRRKIRLLRPLESFIYKQYDRIIGISNAASANLREYIRLTDDKVYTIFNGVDTVLFKNAEALDRESFDFTDNDFLLIMVARFSNQKDQKTVIRSMSYLPENIKLTLAGEGPTLNSCKQLVDELNLNSRIRFLGNRNDIPQLLKMSNVSIISSIWEGFGLVAVESMAAGLPVIGSNVPGLADVIGSSGLIFDKGDDKQLSSKILELSNSQQTYKRFVDKGLLRADKFDIKIYIDKHLELYERLFNEKK